MSTLRLGRCTSPTTAAVHPELLGIRFQLRRRDHASRFRATPITPAGQRTKLAQSRDGTQLT